MLICWCYLYSHVSCVFTSETDIHAYVLNINLFVLSIK